MALTNDKLPGERILEKRVFGHLEMGVFFRVFRVFMTIKDPGDIEALTLFYAAFLSHFPDPDVPTLTALNVAAVLNVRKVIAWMRGEGDEGWTTEEDPYLSFSYHLLVRKEITRAEAAQFASAMLGYPIEQDSWRKRVDRWARLRKFAPIGQTKRRPRK